LHSTLYDRVLDTHELGKSRLDHFGPWCFPAAFYPRAFSAVFRIVCGEDAVGPGKCPPDTGAIMATRSCKNGVLCLGRTIGRAAPDDGRALRNLRRVDRDRGRKQDR